MTTPPTEQQLDEIETRAAARRTALSGWINCYSPLSEQETLEDAEAVLGKDVPGLVAEVRRLRSRVAELEVGLNDLAALVSQWHGRAKKAEAALDDVRRLVRRLAAHAVGFQDVLDESDRGPWGRTVGADIAELSATVAPDAASEVTSAPLRPSQPSSASESAQSPTGAPTGRVGDSGALEPESPLPDRLEAVLTRRFTELGNPYSRMRIAFQGPDGWPASKEVGPHDVAEVLRELLTVTTDGEQQATARCGHDIETALGTYPCERDTDHDGDCDERTEAEYAAEGSGH